MGSSHRGDLRAPGPPSGSDHQGHEGEGELNLRLTPLLILGPITTFFSSLLPGRWENKLMGSLCPRMNSQFLCCS